MVTVTGSGVVPKDIEQSNKHLVDVSLGDDLEKPNKNLVALGDHLPLTVTVRED